MSYSMDGSDDVMEYTAGAIVTGAPCTFVIWYKIPATLKLAVLMSACTAATGNHMLSLITEADGDLRAEARTTTTNAAQAAGVVAADNVWHCAIAIYRSATSREVWHDGVKGTDSATSQTPSTINMFSVGDRPGVVNHFAGLVAYMTVYSTDLSSGNVASIWNSGAGADPRNVGTPVAFYDTSRDQGSTIVNEMNPGTFDLAVTGATFNADDPFSLTDTGTEISESIAVADEAIRGIVRPRQFDEAFALTDSTDVKPIRLRNAIDTVAVTDGLVEWTHFKRVTSDAFSLTTGDLLRAWLVTFSDNIEMADTTVRWRRFRRLITEQLDIVDGFVKSLAGQGITYTRILGDTITLIDDTGNRWTYRTRNLADAANLSDEAVRCIIRMREVSDDVTFSDGEVHFRRNTRFVDEDVRVVDDVISLSTAEVISPTNFTFGARSPSTLRFGAN